MCFYFTDQHVLSAVAHRNCELNYFLFYNFEITDVGKLQQIFTIFLFRGVCISIFY